MSPPDARSRDAEARSGHAERRALAWCAAAAVLIIAWLGHLLLTGLFLGTIAAFLFEPLHEALRRRTHRPGLAAAATVAIGAIAILGAVAGFASLFVTRAVALTSSLVTALSPGGTMTPWVHAGTVWLARLGVSPDGLIARLKEAATTIASQSATVAAAGASATLSTLLALFFGLMAMHLTLLHWNRAVTMLAAVAPLRPEHTRTILGAFRRTGRTTLLGTAGTGAAQGALATLGYWVTGVPEPVFFGIATALASIVPVVGTAIVWLPAGLYLILSGQAAWGIAELVWGALVVVGFSDYVIRPRLVGEEDMPVLLTFLALFGGIEVMGIAGLVVGPVLMSVAVVTLRLYAREARGHRPSTGDRQ